MGANAVTPPLPPGFEMDPPPPAGFVLDSPAAPPRGLGATPRTGAAAVPTAEEAATGVYTPPPVTPAAAPPTPKQRMTGLVEAGLELFSQAVGQTLGITVGGGVGLAKVIGEGRLGDPAAAQEARQMAERGGEVGAQLVRRGLGMNPITGPLVQASGARTGEEMSPAGQDVMDAVAPVIQALPAFQPAIGPAGAAMAGLEPAAAMARDGVQRGLQGPVRAVRAAVDAVAPERAPAAGTKGSAGAAATDVATQRRERAADMPVPLRITKGMATRDFEAQRFEKETAKDPETGKPLRDRQADLGEGVLKNFEAFVEQTGASDVDAPTVGRNVVDPIVEKARKAKDEIRAAYNAADEAGETAEPVNYTPLRAYIEDQTPTQRQKLAPVLDMVQEQLQRNDPEGTGKVTLKALEDIRKAVRANAQPGTPNGVAGGELLKRIDAIADQGTGDLYRKARSMYAEYAAEFKNRGVIRDLINLKKGTSDRRVAFEDVLDRSVLGGTMDDVKNLRETLVTAGPKGEQAWKDVRGAVLERIKRETFSNDARDERGNKVPSSAKLGKLIDKLDEDGRLDFLFGKQGAAQLRDLREVVADIYTAPPGAVNTSGTASVLKQAVDTMLTFGATGVPVPALTALKAIAKKVKERQTKKLVREALGDDAPLPPSTRRPFEEPPTPPAPPPAAPRGTPPAGGAAEPIPVPKARELTLEQANAAIKTAAQPSKIPAGEARELSPAEAGAALRPSKRERELMSLRDEATDAEVLKEIDAEIKAERKRSADQARGEEFLRLADRVTDPELRARFEQRAADLGAKREKIPTGKAREISLEEANQLAQGGADPAAGTPSWREFVSQRMGEYMKTEGDHAGAMRRISAEWKAAKEGAGQQREPLGAGVEVAELEPEVVDAVAAFTENAEARADWQRTHRFGDLDARAAEDVARALQYDAAGTERAVQQLERSPRAFEREIRRIIEEGDARASQAKQATGGSEGSARAAGEGDAGGAEAGRVPTGEGQPRPDGDAAPAAQPARPLRPGGQDGAVAGDGEAVQRVVDYLRENPQIPQRLREGILERYRLAERAKPRYDRAVQAAAADLGAKVAEVLLAPIKFPTRAVAKILADYRGDPTKIKDLVRGTIVIRDIGSAKDAIAALEKRLGKLEGLRNSLDENLPAPTEDGYRDIKATVIVDGLPTEIQVNVPEMIAAKAEAHPLYERVAKIERQADEAGRDLTPEEAAERQELKDRQRRIYDSAWEAATRLRKSASDTTVPLREIDSSGKRLGSAASNARGEVPPSSATGTPSTSKNLVPGGKDLGSSTGITSANSLADTPAGRQTIATTERGVEIPVLYRAVDVGQLVTSHDDSLRVDPRFPPELQPRDRSRQASELQITRIENDIKPNLLAESYKASDGAPIVGADGVVESGNARTIALRRAYAGGKADHYREWLIENAARFGLDAKQLRGMKQPMLIRQGLGEYDRAEFARQANESAVSAMSETEQARSDAARMPDLEGLEVNDSGEMLQSASAAFVRDFLRTVVSPNERNAMVTADGKLSQRGAARIRNAIFAKAYGAPDIVAMLTEATDGNVKNILAGMLRASPAVARIRELIDAGARPPVQFVPDLLDAVRRFSRAREDGMKVDQALSQVGMFGDEASPRVAALMRELEDNARAPKRVAEMIQRFVDEIDQQGDPRQGGLFGDGDGTGSLADDLGRQQQFLAQRARAAGFKDIDEWAAGDIEGFTKAAAEWRKRNPGGGGLMLVPAALGLGLAGAASQQDDEL